MPETQVFSPYSRTRFFSLAIVLLSCLLVACANKPQQQNTATFNSSGFNPTNDVSQMVADQTYAANEQETEASLADDTDNNDTQLPIAVLLDTELTNPDPEHTTLDSENNNNDAHNKNQNINSNTAPSGLDDLDFAETDIESDIEIQNNIWDRLRQRFRLQDSEHRRTLEEKKWYSTHQEYINRTVERARPYLHFIAQEAEKFDVPAELVLLPIVESAFQPFAYSHGRAAGIWQFIPSTGKIFGLKQNWWYDGRRDIEASTQAAFTYLNKLKDSFDGDWLLALAAYNSGQGTVKKAIKYNRRHGKPTNFWSLRLPRETRAYVPKLLAISAIIKNPDEYGVSIPVIADESYLTKIDIGTQIDLALAADLADISIDELYRLNPAFNRWATDPDGPHHLLIPITNADRFTEQLANVPESKRIKWARHKIKNGETLGHIARHYHTTVNVLQDVNNLRGNMIRAGKNLIIPVSTKQMNSYTLSAGQRTQSIQNSPKHGYKSTYTVRKGDTLWDIARYHHVSVNKLAKWNGMAPRDVLHLGQKLVIWQSTRSDSAHVNTTTPSDIDRTQRINYTVKNGDSLARISQRFKVKISQLRQWNALPKNKYLQPGQRLTLFIDVTRQAENI